MRKINLISGPRNISTAMMYSFAQRSDTRVIDEPFYAVYFRKSGVVHPGREEILKAQPQTEDEVFASLDALATSPLLFIKNMAHHIEVLNNPRLDSFSNIFLIRNPMQIIASYSEVIEKPIMRDIGLEYQHELFERLTASNQEPAVIDSGLLLENPTHVMKELCTHININFEESMMQWPSGPKPYDGVWAPYWYKNVHNSTGFVRQSTSSRKLRSDFSDLYEQARFYYEKLLPFAITP
jgi:hypothetical protein